MNAARKFEVAPAERKAVGLLIGLVGPSSSGKTYSALRLAEGIRRVAGGDVAVMDTENKRALYYADRFKFQHMDFRPPFSSEDYLEGFDYLVKQGFKTIVVDSMSHEHEGPGGLLEWHEAECERLQRQWNASRDKVQMAAWAAPKAARRRLINGILQLNVNLIMTFRAKEKIKVVGGGKPPVALGWQPICGEEFMYEMVLQALLLPASEGRPVWQSDMESERAVMKLPAQFADIFDRNKPAQFSEDIGERLAKWAAGGSPAKAGPSVADQLVDEYSTVSTADDFAALEKRRSDLWKAASPADKGRLKGAADLAQARLATREPGSDDA